MTTTATLYVSVNGGATTRGHVTAAVGNTLQFSRGQTDGARTVRYELYGFPPDYTCPSGWLSGDGIYFYNGDTPPAITASEWGKFLPRLRLNGASDTDTDGLVDSSTGIDIPSSTGVHDLATGELEQCGGIDKTLQRDLRVLSSGATTSSAGLMTAAQVVQLNAAVLSKAYGRLDTDVMLTTNAATVLIPTIEIGGLDASTKYAFVVGVRICVHQTGSPNTCGFIDIVAYGYVVSNSSGGAGVELRVLGSVPDQSKLPAAIATATATVADGTDSFFYITATRPTGVAMVVDSVEYRISSLERLTA